MHSEVFLILNAKPRISFKRSGALAAAKSAKKGIIF